MNKKLKTKWIKALRSGHYRQGEGWLRSGGQYCCLGVLANIQGAKWIERVPYIDKKQASSSDMSEGFLRPCFAGGLRHSTQNRLANMNDGDGSFADGRKSFKEIADYIEKHL